MLDHCDAAQRVFHALGDPTRRAMVERLAAGPLSVSELARPLPITLAAALQHVQLLEDNGLIRSEKTGRVRSCQIEPAGLAIAEEWIRRQRTAWELSLDRLGDYLDEPDPSPERSTR